MIPTPPNEKGLKTHYDTHDVFVLQTYGAKRWRIYDLPVRLPLTDHPYVADVSNDPGEPSAEFTMNSGDLLYLPRGYLHDAVSLEASSLHLTIGIKPVTWASVIFDAVQAVIDRDLRMRESSPPGFAFDPSLQRQSEARLSEIIASVCDQIKPGAAIISEAGNRAVLARYPSLEGHLLDLESEVPRCTRHQSSAACGYSMVLYSRQGFRLLEFPRKSSPHAGRC